MTVRTRAELKSDAATAIPDNTDGQVSPEDVRDRFEDIADSALLPEDIGDVVQAHSPLLDAVADMTDPGADAVQVWDDVAGQFVLLLIGAGLSLDSTLSIDKASVANMASGAADKVLTTDIVKDASAAVPLTFASPTTSVNWTSARANFSLTLTGNTTIGNPTNEVPGEWRTIFVQGNNSTDRTISFGGEFLGEVPVITDCDSTTWYAIDIQCIATSHFVASKRVIKKP